MTTEVGYCLVEGSKGEKIAETTTVFATKMCYSVLKRGATSSAPDLPFEEDTNKFGYKSVNFQEEKAAASKQMNNATSQVKVGPVKMKVPMGGATKVLNNTDGIATSRAKDSMSSALTSGSGFTQQPASVEMAIRAETEQKIETPEWMQGGNSESSDSSSSEESSDSSSSTDSDMEIKSNDSKSAKFFKKNTQTMKAKAAKMEARKAAIEDKTNDVAKWFDDMEALLDSLPTMSDGPGMVYEVEKKKDTKTGNDEWYYTGKVEPMDNDQLEKLNEVKANVCAFLTAQVTKVTKWVDDKLTEETNKLDNCEPYATAITIIMNPPSLTTIIKWATSVIDFVLASWKMIYGLFKSTLKVIEMIIIRVPMLINKLMKKITDFKCPIKANIDMNVNTNVVDNG